MRRVLLLAHHFPPIGGVVGRNLALARWLADFGYEPVVLTGPGDVTDRWAPQDAALRARIKAMDVHRVPGPVPAGRTGSVARVARWLELSAPWTRWWVEGTIAAARELEGPFDAVLANLIPYETAFAATEIARERGIPWVADLEDPWALDEMRVAPSIVNYRVDLGKMRRGLRSADGIVMNCAEAAARLRRELPELRGIVDGIPHGFTREDFEGAAPRRDDDAFRIVHTGNLHTQLGLDHQATHRIRTLLRGTSLDVDILPRSLKYLLEAIERVGAAEPELAARIELHLAGNLTPADREIADRHPFIHAHGQLPHAETIALSRSADLLFVPMHELPPGKRATIVPCKTYEYLAAGPPILAAVPDGDARELLERFDRASVVRPRDAAGMAEALAAALKAPGPARDRDELDSPLLAAYERRHLVGRVAGVLDSVLGVASEPARLAA